MKVAIWILSALVLAGAVLTILFMVKNKKQAKVIEELKKAATGTPAGAGSGTNTTTTNTTVTNPNGTTITVPAGTPLIETPSGKKFVALN